MKFQKGSLNISFEIDRTIRLFSYDILYRYLSSYSITILYCSKYYKNTFFCRFIVITEKRFHAYDLTW